MASTVKEIIKVQELTKYGVKVNDEYYNWSKQCKDQGSVVPGGEYDVTVYVADSGKKYINSVDSKSFVEPKKEAPKAEAPKVSDKSVDVERAVKFTPKFEKTEAPSATMSKGEWAAKDTRISRQGVIQAAVQAVAPLVALEKVFEEADKLATQMLEFVNRRA